MARKDSEGAEDMQDPGRSDLSARPRVRAGSAPVPEVSPLWIALRVSALGLVLVAGLYGFHRVEQFLIRDPRFALSGPDGSLDTPALGIRGATHASPRAIQAVFSGDAGRSVYLMPLSERRDALRSVVWVKDASVARIWPNQLLVSISERRPVAFVTLSPSQVALIDEDGVILPPSADRFNLPVLAGVRSRDTIAERRERVRRMQHVLQELGGMADKISEIDVSDRDDVKVTEPYEGRMVTLLLGDHDFAVRYRNFVNHYAEIKRRLPGAATLDLRLEDRITVVE